MDPEAKTAFARLEKTLVTHGEQISELKDDVADIRSTLATHGEQISELKDDVADIRSTVATHGEQIADIQSTLATHGEQIADIQSTLATHGEQLSELKTDVRGLKVHLEVELPRYFEILREDFRSEFRLNAERARKQDDRFEQHEGRLEGAVEVRRSELREVYFCPQEVPFFA